MQVSPVATPAVRALTGQAGMLVLPNLLNLARVGPQTQTLRQQREDDEQEAAQDYASRASDVTLGTTVQGATDSVYEAERRMAPTSRAARRQLQDQAQQQATRQSKAFQRTLADASARENGRATNTTPRSPGAQTADSPTGQTSRPTTSGHEDSGSQPARTTTDAAKSGNSSNAAQPATPQLATPGAANPAATNNAPLTSAAARNIGQSAAIRAVGPAGAPRAAAPTAAKAAQPNPSGEAKSSAPSAATPAAARARAAKTISTTAGTRAAAETAKAGKSDANIERMLRVVRSQISQDRTRATLRLDPPELGTIRLQMDLRKDVLSLRVETQTPLAHRLLTEQVESLRQGLQASGIQLEHVEVRPPAATDEANDPNLSQHADARQTGHEQSNHADAEHSQDAGTDSSPTTPAETTARDTTTEPAAESLVNILA